MSPAEQRKLLELAAKAAGYRLCHYLNGSGAYVSDDLRNNRFDWNPSDDDGDALRLAVKLNILVYQTGGDQSYASTPANWSCTVPHSGDPCAATRLAIVRAAADIGEAMP